MNGVAMPPRGSFRGPLAKAWGERALAPQLQTILQGAGELLTPAAFARASRLSAGNSWAAAAEQPKFRPVLTMAADETGSPWPQLLASQFARYFRDGNRTDYEWPLVERQSRLSRAVVMALVTEGDEPVSLPWLDDVIDGVMLLCEQTTWCWGAHEDVFNREGRMAANTARPFLDLGAGEVVAQLGWLDLVLGERLEARLPGIRARIREEAMRRVIGPFLDRDDWHWLGLDGHVHNWNPWIHSNVLLAALALIDDAKLRGRVVELAIEGLDRFLSSIPADGAIDEGFAYWWNGAGRALEALDLLETGSAGVLSVAGIEQVHAVLDFPHKMHLGGTWYLNVADGPARAHNGLPWEMVHGWALRLGHSDAARHAAAQLGEPVENTQYLGRLLHALATVPDGDPAWDEAAPGRVPSFCYLPSVQIMVARYLDPAGGGLTLAAKGGHNGENHNHHDVGSIVVAVDDIPLLVDAGQPTYTADTFGPHRYLERSMQSRWHSAPAPWGLEQQTGAGHAAVLLQAPTQAQPLLALDLAGAYGLEAGARWHRSAGLNVDGKVMVSDAWELSAIGGEDGSLVTAIHYLAAGTVKLDRVSRTAVIHPAGIPGVSDSQDQRGLSLRWDPGAAVVHLETWELADPMLQKYWGATLHRLRFEFPQATTAGEFTVSMEAVN